MLKRQRPVLGRVDDGHTRPNTRNLVQVLLVQVLLVQVLLVQVRNALQRQRFES
jgi:hypothetical protein